MTLAFGALKIQYTFDQPYETRVKDRSLNSNHAVKPASGTNSVVNTSRGIFIKANSMITCPPNSYATIFPSSTSFTTTVLVRFIKIETSNQDRTFVVFNSASTDCLRLYKDKSTNSDNSSKEFFATVQLSSSVTLTSSNLFPNSIWTLLAVTVSFTSPNSTVKLFVNNSQQATQTSAGSMPSPAGCSINGENTDAIYYEFRYYDSALALTDMYGTVFKSGSTDCNSYSYACKANGDQLCNSDSYQVNENCSSCTSCGNFACYSTGCFSCSLEITDSACDACFANSKANSDNTACECSTGYYASSSSPLTCASCTVDSTSCNACYPNSELNSGACACLTGYFASSSSPLTCTSYISCIVDSTSCNACYPNSELNSGACACSTGFYASSSSPLTCTSCTTDSTSCNACYPNSEKENSICVCLAGFFATSTVPLICSVSIPNEPQYATNCLDNFYPNKGLCTACSVECKTCNGSTNADCLECKETYAKTEGKCTLKECDIGFFKEKNTCLSCDSSCFTCYGLTNNDCILCADGFYLQPFSTSLCLYTCPTGSSKLESNVCSAIEGSNATFSFQSWSQTFSDSSKRFVALMGSSLDTSDGPIPSYERGYYFDGSTQVQFPPHSQQSEGYIFALKFSVLFWIKGKGTFFSVSDESDAKISISLNEKVLGFWVEGETDLSNYAFQSQSDEWKYCSVSLDLLTLASIDCSGTSFTQIVINSSFISKPSDLTFVGRDRLGTNNFVGFLAELTLVNQIKLASDSLTLNYPQSYSSSLSNCQISEFSTEEGECQECLSECDAGCRSDNDCSLCDPSCSGLCSGFSSSECCKSRQVYSSFAGECIYPNSTSVSSTILQEQQQEQTASAAASSTLGALAAGSLLTGNPDIFVSLFMSLELLSYLPLIELDLDQHQTNLLTSSNQISKIGDLIPGLECDKLDRKNELKSVKCKSFLKSAAKELMTVILLVFAYSFALLIDRKQADIMLVSKLKSLLAGFLVKVLNSVLVDLLVKAFLFFSSMRTLSLQSVVGCCLSAVTVLSYSLIAWLVFKSSKQPQESSSILNFKEFKPSSLYYSILILHRMFFSVCVTCFDFPSIQIGLVSVTTLLVRSPQFSAYLLYSRPFISQSTQILHTGASFGLSFYFIAIFIQQVSTFSASVKSEIVTSSFFVLFYSLLGLSIFVLIIFTAIKAFEVYKSGENDGSEVEL